MQGSLISNYAILTRYTVIEGETESTETRKKLICKPACISKFQRQFNWIVLSVSFVCHLYLFSFFREALLPLVIMLHTGSVQFKCEAYPATTEVMQGTAECHFPHPCSLNWFIVSLARYPEVVSIFDKLSVIHLITQLTNILQLCDLFNMGLVQDYGILGYRIQPFINFDNG